MTLCTLHRQALHVLFSFAQADRPADLRLTARLLMCSQREVRACLERLAELGLVDASGAITEAGMIEAARLRQQRGSGAAERRSAVVRRAA
jgi:Mn-dependent DtxR family transcriptional regulator